MTNRLEGGRLTLAVVTIFAVVVSMFALAMPQAQADHIPDTGEVPSNCVKFDFGDVPNTGTKSPSDYPGVSITLDSWDETPTDPHEVTFTISGLTGADYVDVSLKSGQVVDEVGPFFNGQTTILTDDQNAISHITLCVFEGSPTKGRIIVKKEVTEGSTTTVFFDFTSDFDGGFSLSDGQSNDKGDLEPGTYSVSETVPEGWELQSANCVSTDEGDNSTPGAINVSGGETVTCTFVNHELPTEPEPGDIVVIKQVEGAETQQTFGFNPSYGEAFSLGDGGENDSGPLNPGSYSVSETVPQGWAQPSASCVSTEEDDQSTPAAIDLDEGETVTCTFVNRRTPPPPPPPPPSPGNGIIIVRKVVTSGDTGQSFNFTASYGAGFSLKGGEQTPATALSPGIYSVTETVPAGWTLQSATCSDGSLPSSISLSEGETVTCTFTNLQDQVAASIVVTVGEACVTDSEGNGTGVINVTVSVAGGATVVVRSGATVVATFTEDGSVSVPEGQTYTWEATTNEGFEFPAGFVSSGTLVIETCSDEVLPFTGMESERLLGMAVLLLGAGGLLVLSSRRREEG